MVNAVGIRLLLRSFILVLITIIYFGCAEQINDDNTGVPIEISGIHINADGTVNVSWSTETATLGAVEFGTASGIFNRYAYTARVRYDTVHNVRIFGLSVDSLYRFRVRGITRTGEVYFSKTNSFKVTNATYHPSVLKVHMINVSGNGDCFFMEMPNGKTILYDAGSSSGGYMISGYLNSLNCTTINYAVLTHAHADHYGNYNNGYLPSRYVINNFLRPDSCSIDSSLFNTAYNTIQNYSPSAVQYRLHRGQSSANTGVLQMDPSVQITVMSAGADELPIDVGNSGGSPNSNVNNQSLAMIFQYGQARIFMAGDLEQEAYRAFIENNPATNPEVDILKVSHHIRDDGVNLNMLNALKPKIAIACTQSSPNCSGLMQCPALNTLLDFNVDVFRSDAANPNLNRSQGNDAKYYSHVLITTDGATILIQTGI